MRRQLWYTGRMHLLLLLSACASDGPTPAPQVAAPPPTAAVAAAPEAAGATATTCTIGAPDTWASCEGQVVRMEGTTPKMVHNHPLMAGGPPGTTSLVQEYMDVEGGAQVVVITSQAVDCTGKMVATGTLHSVDLGGAEGTPDSYKGWRIDGATVSCL
jgi:hypothetical protein